MLNLHSGTKEHHGIAQVRAFLSAMEDRDLPRAKRYLAATVTIRFPGSPTMSRLSEVVEWAQARYRQVHKTFHAVDLRSDQQRCANADHCVVVCHGELSVEWLDGSTSNGVRFIDRFELTDGLITRQEVWNDLALVRR